MSAPDSPVIDRSRLLSDLPETTELLVMTAELEPAGASNKGSRAAAARALPILSALDTPSEFQSVACVPPR